MSASQKRIVETKT